MAGNKKRAIPAGKNEFEKAVKQNLEVVTGRTLTKIQPVNLVETSPTAEEFNALAKRFNQLLSRLQD